MPSSDVQDFRRLLASSKHIIVVSGAGLSVSSGISTFRGKGGMWRKYDSASLATLAAWQESQSRVWQFFHYRREEIRKALPNEGHRCLARLTIPSLRKVVAPASTFLHVGGGPAGIEAGQDRAGRTPRWWFEPRIYYMLNVLQDELLTKSGTSALLLPLCLDSGHPTPTSRRTSMERILSSPICPALAGTELLVEAGDIESVVKRADLPHCPECGQLLRPDVTLFQERPKQIREILDLADRADLCIVVGTSAVVQPASRIGERVQAHGGKVAVFNTEMSNHADKADFVFLGPCEEILQAVINV